MGERNVPQPDITLRVLPEFGGQSQVQGNYPVGAPELVVEVAASSRGRDIGEKLRLYERSGVIEYLIADASQEQFLWKELTPELGYQPLEPGTDGIFRSRRFPGLWLDPEALWRLDPRGLLAVLQQGLATPAHAAFVASLAASHE
jgi:Uma2 family endonuclease